MEFVTQYRVRRQHSEILGYMDTSGAKLEQLNLVAVLARCTEGCPVAAPHRARAHFERATEDGVLSGFYILA
jgi:hypothetical protein